MLLASRVMPGWHVDWGLLRREARGWRREIEPGETREAGEPKPFSRKKAAAASAASGAQSSYFSCGRVVSLRWYWKAATPPGPRAVD